MAKRTTAQTVKLDDGREVLLSYGVPVAAYVPGHGYVRTATKYSVTTSRHVNAYAGHAAREVPAAEFAALVAPLTVPSASPAERLSESSTVPTTVVLTQQETREWLSSLGLRRVRLPKAARILFVEQPGGGAWEVRLNSSPGYYSVRAMRPWQPTTTHATASTK